MRRTDHHSSESPINIRTCRMAYRRTRIGESWYRTDLEDRRNGSQRAGNTALESQLESRPGGGDTHDGRGLLSGLVGRPIQTISGAANEILEVRNHDVVVATG